MPAKIIVGLIVATLIAHTIPLSYGQDIIFCDGFESCPESIQEMEARIAELEAKLAHTATFVLLDSDSPPKPVGEIVSVLISKAFVRIEIAGKPEHVEVRRGYIPTTGVKPRYLTDDCTGQQYSGSGLAGELGSWFLRDDFGISALMMIVDNSGPGRESGNTAVPFLINGPYIQLDFAATYAWDAVTIDGIPTGEFTCDLQGYTDGVSPVQQLAEDLHVTYPPPYTLQVK